MRLPHTATERPPLDDEVLDRIFVEELLEHLSPRQRRILELLYWKDLSCEEVARILGEEERGSPYANSTIRYHEAKILRKLGDKLGIPPKVRNSPSNTA